MDAPSALSASSTGSPSSSSLSPPVSALARSASGNADKSPAARGRDAHAPTLTRQQLEDLAAALGCPVDTIADRAALSTTTRVLYGLEPLGPARTIVAGREFDLTDAETGRVLDFIAGIVAARDLGQ